MKYLKAFDTIQAITMLKAILKGVNGRADF